MCTTNTAPAFEIVDSSAFVEEPASVFGEHYADGMHGAEVARELRAAFKSAQKFGAFKGVKVSITSDRYSGGSAVRVTITEAPFAASERRAIVRNIRAGDHVVNATSARMRLLVAQITMLANLWRRDDSDSATDYFNCNCYLSVDVNISDRDERIAAHGDVAGRAVRAIVERVDALSPLADDRAALAAEMLARGEVAAAADLVREAAAGSSVEAHVAAAVLAVADAIVRAPYEYRNAAICARPLVSRALAALGRGQEYADGVMAAAFAA